MDITITINTDNAAFEDDYAREVERILLDVARRIKHEGREAGASFSLRDINGNTVGKVVVE